MSKGQKEAENKQGDEKIINSRKSVRWSAVPVLCLSRLSLKLILALRWDLGLEFEIWASKLRYGPPGSNV